VKLIKVRLSRDVVNGVALGVYAVMEMEYEEAAYIPDAYAALLFGKENLPKEHEIVKAEICGRVMR